MSKKELRNEYGLLFNFHSFCQDCPPTYPENQMKKNSSSSYKRLVISRNYILHRKSH